MRFVTIDFEASCLPRHGRSFPIEVGITRDTGATRSWLIRPTTEWSAWDWTEEAQSLHGISREQLDREGLPVELVAAELIQSVAGYRVIADSYLDEAWLGALAQAARVAPPFRIEHVEAIVDRLGARPDDVAAARSYLEGQVFARHRAGEDARWLARFITTLAGVVGRRAAADKPLFGWDAVHGEAIRHGDSPAAAAYATAA